MTPSSFSITRLKSYHLVTEIFLTQSHYIFIPKNAGICSNYSLIIYRCPKISKDILKMFQRVPKKASFIKSEVLRKYEQILRLDISSLI